MCTSANEDSAQAPILFGTPNNQKILLSAYENGAVRKTTYTQYNRLLKSGLVRETKLCGKPHFILERRHPHHRALLDVLSALTGKPRRAIKVAQNAKPVRVSPSIPLAQVAPIDFRTMLCIARAKSAIDAESVARRIPDAWPFSVRDSIERLTKDGILVTDPDGTVRFSENVPAAYRALVLKLGTTLAKNDPRIAASSSASGKRVAAFNSAPDSAPRLFETDLRLRNLMALAKYGPMNIKDLRRVTGAGNLKMDPYDHAPFGRGEIVRTWKTADGTAAMLDVQHPASRPLRRMLRKLEKRFPLPPLVRAYPTPTPPKAKRWGARARLHLFGNPIPTTILLSIGALGWTFEALCVELAVGYHRENVKKAMRRMEEEGILAADRPRKPGFNVRKVTISPTFPAAKELEAVLKAYLTAWPEFGRRVEIAMSHLPPRTREHLRRRGLSAD